ncbi:MAG TPA: M48 family metallopeptidase [Tepidisphaeraceae bacterium]|nr:M48 family metallopeptidase [Tepidisphaeraceae bacterium]
MDFFSSQDRARRHTSVLVIYFTVAVILIVVAINLLAIFVVDVASAAQQPDRPRNAPQVQPRSGLWQWDIITYATLGTLLVIGGGSYFKMAQLRRGGRAVAQLMGATPVPPAPTDSGQKMLRNVVEEMSIASGVPVPAIFIMQREQGINAFAAGFTPQDAVVCVTQGCLDRLTREELQGVIGHEFSHILNGDVRINVQLVGLLFGILVIGLIGYGLIRAALSTDDSDKDIRWMLAFLAIGCVLMVIGFVGLFFGRLIQAAVCRQREYLADAASVQFTRNPTGLAGALKKIGATSSASRIGDHDAEQIAHMFFASSAGIGRGWFATHPPLPKRIKALDTAWDGKFSPAIKPAHAPAPAPATRYTVGQVDRDALRGIAPVAAMGIAASVGTPMPRHVQWASDFLSAVPPVLNFAAHDSFSARALVFAILLSDDQSVRQKQLAILNQSTDATTVQTVGKLAGPAAEYGPRGRRILVDLALPALRQMSTPQCQQFGRIVQQMIDADGRVTLFEYMLHKILAKFLTGSARSAAAAPAYYALKPLLPDVQVVLSALSRADGKDAQAINAAFAAGLARLQLDQPLPLLESTSIQQLDGALDRLSQSAPGIKRRVVDACAFSVAADQMVQTEEGELLRAITSTLDCPLPPLLAEHSPVPQPV